MTTPAEDATPSVVNQIFKRLWKVFKRSDEIADKERQAFVIHAAGAVRICKRQGWEIPAIEIETEEVTE